MIKNLQKTVASALILSTSFGVVETYSAPASSVNYIVIGTNTVLKDGKVYMSLADAITKAIANDRTYETIDAQIDYLKEQKRDLINSIGGITVPTLDDLTTTSWVDSMTHTYATTIMNFNSSIEQLESQTGILELATEVSIRNMFSGIVQNETNLDLLKKSRELEQISYEQALIKLDFGQVSQSSVDQLKSQLEQTDMNIAQLQTQIEQLYIDLNNETGQATKNRYVVEKLETLERYTLGNFTLPQFISNSFKLDTDVVNAQNAVDQALINTRYMADTVTDADIKLYDLELYNAKIDLLNIKSEKEIALQDAYNSLTLIEQAYDKALLDIKIAEDNLKLAEINYNAGNITELTLKQTELAVVQSEVALEQLIYNYDLQVFLFEHSSLL